MEQPRRGRRKRDSQQNIFQDSKNAEVYILGLESAEGVFRSYGFLNVKTAISC